MTDNSIGIGYFVVYEPVTALTDYMITILCICFFVHLKKFMQDSVVKNWNLFFLFFGIAAAVGGSAHAFFGIHKGFSYDTVWLTGQLLIIPSTYFAQRATLHSALRDHSSRKYWQLSYVIQLIVSCIAVVIFHDLWVVILNSAIGLIPIMISHFRKSNKDNWSKWIAYGILLSFLTAFVNGAKLSLHVFFNYKDISHVLIMMSLGIIFIGLKINTLNIKCSEGTTVQAARVVV